MTKSKMDNKGRTSRDIKQDEGQQWMYRDGQNPIVSVQFSSLCWELFDGLVCWLIGWWVCWLIGGGAWHTIACGLLENNISHGGGSEGRFRSGLRNGDGKMCTCICWRDTRPPHFSEHCWCIFHFSALSRRCVWWTSNCTHVYDQEELGLLNKLIVYWSAPSPKTRDNLQ